MSGVMAMDGSSWNLIMGAGPKTTLAPASRAYSQPAPKAKGAPDRSDAPSPLDLTAD